MYAEIIAAFSSFKQLSELLAAAKALSNYNEIVAAVAEVNSKLMDATTVALSSQEKQAMLANRISELEHTLAERKDWEEQINRYILFKFPTGKLAYSLKSGMEQGEPHHYLCATCVDKRQTSHLQTGLSPSVLYCHQCQYVFETYHET